MRCVCNRINLDQVNDDFFGPETLGRIMGINSTAAYNLVKQPGFPKLRVGRKYIIAKAGLMRWLEEQKAI